MNKRERLTKVLSGGFSDYVPSSYWFHFTDIPDVGGKAAAHLNLHKKTDMDFMKIMYEFGFSLDAPISTSSDWRKIKPVGRTAPEYKKQIELIQRIQDELNENCMVFTTVFGALKMAQFLSGEEKLMQHLRDDPMSVVSGLNTISEMLLDWIDGYSSLGIDGIMYAAQYGEKTRFSKAFWEIAVKPFDIASLSEIRNNNLHILLHMCGMAQYDKNVDLDRYLDYPMDIASWAVHSSHLSLKEGREKFGCPILGGMDNYGSITGDSCEEIANTVQSIIHDTGKEGLIMGADCVILKNPSIENVRTAVMAARL